eukprot:3941081-Rhodomonas_salina.3
MRFLVFDFALLSRCEIEYEKTQVAARHVVLLAMCAPRQIFLYHSPADILVPLACGCTDSADSVVPGSEASPFGTVYRAHTDLLIVRSLSLGHSALRIPCEVPVLHFFSTF